MAEVTALLSARDTLQTVPFRPLINDYKLLLTRKVDTEKQLAIRIEELAKYRKEFGDSPRELLRELRQRVEDLSADQQRALASLLDKDAALALAASQAASMQKEVEEMRQQKEEATSEAAELRIKLEEMTKANEELQATVAEKLGIVEVLQSEREQLKNQRNQYEARYEEKSREADDERRKGHEDRESLELYKRELEKSTDMVNKLNVETQRLLNTIHGLKKDRRSRSVSETNPGQDLAALQGQVLEGAKGVGNFFSGVFAKLAPPEEAEVPVDEGLEDEDVNDFNIVLETDHLPKGVQRVFEANSDVLSIRSAFQSPTLVTGTSEGPVTIWDGMTGNKVKSYHGAERSVLCADLSSNGRFVAGASADMCVYLWAYDTGRIVHKLVGHRSPVSAAYFSADSRFLVSGGPDRALKTWDLTKGTCIKSVTSSSKINDLCFASRGMICTAHFDKSVKIYDMRTGTLQHTAQVHNGAVTSIALSPCGNYLLTNSRDNTLALLDARRTFNPVKTFKMDAYRSGIDSNKACFSGSGKYVIAGATGGRICVWNADTSKAETVLEDEHHTNSVLCCCWSSTTNQLYVVYKDSPAVVVWG